MQNSTFSRFVKHHRSLRHWTQQELANRSGLSCPEISRLESDTRTPTLRHVKGLAEALASDTKRRAGNDPKPYETWLGLLVDLGEAARIDRNESRRKNDS